MKPKTSYSVKSEVLKSSRTNKAVLAFITVFIVLLIDQCLKFWVKTHMHLGEEFSMMGDWGKIHFVENEGMAFGFEFGGQYGKLILSLFRIIAVFGIAWFIYVLLKKNVKTILIFSLALIFAGAIGNIIDSIFYGLVFSESSALTRNVATFLPEGGGYAGLLYGKVVDMFYFPLYEGFLPEWVPFWGGEYCVFFRHVFNVADSAITVGVALILLFQRNIFTTEISKLS